jgi:hypothetical protein
LELIVTDVLLTGRLDAAGGIVWACTSCGGDLGLDDVVGVNRTTIADRARIRASTRAPARLGGLDVVHLVAWVGMPPEARWYGRHQGCEAPEEERVVACCWRFRGNGCDHLWCPTCGEFCRDNGGVSLGQGLSCLHMPGTWPDAHVDEWSVGGEWGVTLTRLRGTVRHLRGKAGFLDDTDLLDVLDAVLASAAPSSWVQVSAALERLAGCGIQVDVGTVGVIGGDRRSSTHRAAVAEFRESLSRAVGAAPDQAAAS